MRRILDESMKNKKSLIIQRVQKVLRREEKFWDYFWGCKLDTLPQVKAPDLQNWLKSYKNNFMKMITI